MLAFINAIKSREDVYGVLIGDRDASEMIKGDHITSQDKKAFLDRTRAYLKGVGSQKGNWRAQAEARRHEEEKRKL